MYRKKANQKVLFAGIFIVMLVALIIVLFSLGPTERAFAGQAILTRQQAEVSGSSSADDPGNLFMGSLSEYTLLKNPVANDMTVRPNSLDCPAGATLNAAAQFCSMNNVGFTGWVSIRLNSPSSVKEIRIDVENNADGVTVGTSPGSIPTMDTPRVFVGRVSAGPPFVPAGSTFVQANIVSMISGRSTVNYVLSPPGLIDSIMVARSAQGPNAPDPRVYSVELIPACERVSGNQIVTVNGFSGICQNGIFLTAGHPCTIAGQTVGDSLYCDGQRFITEGERVRTQFLNADGTPIPRPAVEGLCPNANDCVGTPLQGTNLFCFETLEIHPNQNNVCLAGSWHLCNQEGFIQGNNLICLGGTWQPNLNCNRQNEVRGQAVCNGRTYVPCGSETVRQIACLPGATQICSPANNGQLATRAGGDNFYCSAPAAAAGQNALAQWVRCDQQHLGEGVDNHLILTSGVVYNNRYVCAKSGIINPSPVWLSIDCSSCLADAPGFCTGSTVVNAANNNPERDYYLGTERTVLVGCTLNQNGCFYQSDNDPSTANFFGYDEMVTDSSISKQFICGNNNQWLNCKSQSGANQPFYASDGLQWVCDAAVGTWVQCASSIAGAQAGNYECQNVNGRMQWFSAFACNERAKYTLRGGQICNGERFVSCPAAETDPALQTDAGVSVACVNNAVVKRELACFDAGENRDNDRDGQANCQDSDCIGTQDRVLHEEALFTITLAANTCPGLNYNVLTNPAAPQLYSYNQLRVCSDDDSRFADAVKICHGQQGLQSRQFTVQSVDELARTNQRPVVNPAVNLVNPNRRVVFIYEPPEGTGPKEVQAVLALDVTQTEATFPLSNLVNNLLDGQGMMLILNQQFYLLTYPEQPSFSMRNLQLRHVPLKVLYTAEPYAGTNQYVFNVLGQRQIVLKQEGNNLIISTVQPGEAPAAFVVPVNLTKQYEITITKSSPVEITSPATLGLFSICRSDNDADIQQVQVCLQNIPLGTLKLGNLTKLQFAAGEGFAALPIIDTPTPAATRPSSIAAISGAPATSRLFLATLGGSGGRSAVPVTPAATSTEPVSREYLLLYEYNQTTREKKVSLLVLAKPRNLLADLEYNDFINNMVQGRRLGLEFGAELYVLSHPGREVISLPSLALTRILGQRATVFPAVGSQDRVEILILGGHKIILQRRYGTPPPPFQMSALTLQEVLDVPINLDEQLSTVFSSEGPVSISSPTNYGVISQSSQDRVQLRDLFRISSTRQGEIAELNYRQPLRKENVLFYYHSAQPLGTTELPRFVKTAAIYRAYDVLETATGRAFTNQFIQTFTSGKELALKFNDQHYLLSYQGGDSSSPQFFILDNLRLSTLDKARTFTAQVSGRQARFIVPEGILLVELELSPGGDRIVFRTTAAVELLPSESFAAEEYTQQLTAGNKAAVGINNIELDLCNEELYGPTASADVCFGPGSARDDDRRTHVIVSVSSPQLLKIEGENYLLEVNGQTGAGKAVNIRRVITIDQRRSVYTVQDWTKFIANVSAGNGPIFNVSSTLYLPTASSPLLEQSFGFREYPIGRTYNLRKVNPVSSITANGTLALGDDVLRIKQEVIGELRNRIINTEFKLESYLYLPDDGTAVQLNVTAGSRPLIFALEIDDKFYTLIVNLDTGNQRLIRLSELTERNSLDNREGRNLITGRLVAEGDSRTVRIGSQQFEIKVEKINRAGGQVTSAQLSIKRK